MSATAPIQRLSVYPADDMRAIAGANIGDAVSFASELMLDDVYALTRHAATHEIWLKPTDRAATFEVAPNSPSGGAGHAVHLDCLITLMSPDGATSEALVLVEVEDGAVEDIFLLPFASMIREQEYTLVGIDSHDARRKLAEAASVAFTRGTHIAMATGQQRRIEDLKVGDTILTRDEGPQEIRWIGQTTVRAMGDFAPILIAKGALNNEADLIVSPDHRLFVYQRDDEFGVGRSEVLVRARHLLNGETVRRLEGGFVDYFQLVLDRHQIIYAEGIAAESMMIDTRTGPALPDEMARKLGELVPAHAGQRHLAFEVDEALLTGADTIAKLRRASSARRD